MPLLLDLASNGVQLDAASSSRLGLYGLAQCESFCVTRNAIAISKLNIARIDFDIDIDSFVIYDVVWRSKSEGKWRTKQVRSFTEDERNAVSKAEVVPSQYGNSVCFFMNSGGQTYIPLLSTSSLTVGDSVDLQTAKLVTLCREEKDDIYRVMEY